MKNKIKNLLLILLFGGIILSTPSCTEDYAHGECVGLVTKFTRTGLLWKSCEGELHVTQTGMNSTMSEFDFSVDNDYNDAGIINRLDSANEYGWKVKIEYHEVFGKNWFENRGETDCFVTEVDILDKNPVHNEFNQTQKTDTIYLKK